MMVRGETARVSKGQRRILCSGLRVSTHRRQGRSEVAAHWVRLGICGGDGCTDAYCFSVYVQPLEESVRRVSIRLGRTVLRWPNCPISTCQAKFRLQ